MNFGNANKSSPVTKGDILKSYGMALGASVSASIGVRLLTAKQTAKSTGARLAVINAVVSIIACASGGFVNNWFMRQPEIVNGIEITDPANGQVLGKSINAAKEAVQQTATSRIFLAAPVGIPGFILFALERKGMVPRNAALMLLLQLSLISAQLTFAVPMSMAAFPQFINIDASRLEPEFQGLKSSTTGEVIREFRFNKGL